MAGVDCGWMVLDVTDVTCSFVFVFVLGTRGHELSCRKGIMIVRVRRMLDLFRDEQPDVPEGQV